LKKRSEEINAEEEQNENEFSPHPKTVRLSANHSSHQYILESALESQRFVPLERI
jgi:hypothetical protein